METSTKTSMLNIQKLRQDFPILSKKINGKPLVYLDSGATAQKSKVESPKFAGLSFLILDFRH